jgi:hypothetical protein
MSPIPYVQLFLERRITPGECGEEVIQGVALALREELRLAQGQLLARVGGQPRATS